LNTRKFVPALGSRRTVSRLAPLPWIEMLLEMSGSTVCRLIVYGVLNSDEKRI